MLRSSNRDSSRPPTLSASPLYDEVKSVLDKIYATHGQGKWKQKVLINDRIADSIFQQVITRADEYQVIAAPNLNGDYISDACAAQVGGLGMAPGANIGDGYGCFEATHGTAPKYADKDVINPSSVMLSGVMMFEFMGWNEVGKLIEDGIERTIGQKASHIRSGADDGRRNQAEHVAICQRHHRKHAGSWQSPSRIRQRIVWHGIRRAAFLRINHSL